jgi:hypothetical protein
MPGLAMLACGGAQPPASAPVAPAAPTMARAVEPPPPAPPPRTPTRSQPIPRPAGPARALQDLTWRRDVIVIGRDDGIERLPTWLRAGEPTFARKSDYWSPCVRDFVQTQPEAARDTLGEALSHYSTTCSGGPGRRIEFQTPRVAHGAAPQPSLGLVGALERTSCEVALRATVHADSGEPIDAERITLIADGVRWSSPRIDVERDDGWAIAMLPLTRSLARAVRRAADARDAVVRFEGARDYEDVVVTDEMKQDLRIMLDALDAINRP